jgi:hypothetical protein
VSRRRLLAPFIALAAAAGAFLVHGWIPVPRRADLGEPFVPRPEVARLSAVGFRTLMADFYWLRAVQIVGSAQRPEEHGTVLGRYIDVVTTLDPWVGHPYRFAAVWLTGSEEDVRHANALLKRSFAYHPAEWRNRFHLGFNLFYYLEEPVEASLWLERAARMEGSPRYLGALAARLRATGGGLDVAEQLVREMMRGSEDPYKRAEYAKVLEEIGTERLARRLDRARERYHERHGRDIERVADLARGPGAVLRRLPPEPHGWEWTLDEETGEIVSSFYGRRYRPALDPERRARRDGWRVGDGEGEGSST